ncbi:MAG: glycosyltransferase [Gammaproteobacteria bacterium]|nr:glycosyltransferase [Gammaproteobacteria bacterium]
MAEVELLARPDHALFLYEGLKARRDLRLHVFHALRRGSLLARVFPSRKQVAPEVDTLLGLTLAKLGLNLARKFLSFNWREAERRLAEYCYGRIDLSAARLVHYWPMYCQESVWRKKRRYGFASLAEIYEANPVFVNAIVEDEYRRFGIPFAPLNTRIDQNAFLAHERDVVVPSEFIRRSYERDYPHVRWHLAPYGFMGQRAFSDLLTVKTHARLRVAYLGRVCLEKGVHYLAEAVRPLASQVELDIIGPVQTEHAAAYSGLRDIGNIRWLGGMTHTEVLKRLPGYDLLVMPSLSDAYSLAVIEGLMRGVPAIVSENTGCAGEIARYGCGAVVPIRDAEALRREILAFCLPGRRAQAIEGIRRFDAAEAEDGYLGAMDRIYRQLLAENEK